MKLKLLSPILLLLISLKGLGQSTAHPLPDLVRCSATGFNLTALVPAVLGAQDPDDYIVSFHETQVTAEGNTQNIINPVNYTALTSPQIIYVRVTNIANSLYDITSLNLIVNNSDFIPSYEDVFSCDSFTIPAFTQNPAINYEFFFNGVPIPEANGGQPVVITQSGGVTIVAINNLTGCQDVEEFTVTIGTPQAVVPLRYISCDFEDDGTAYFDLTSKIEELAGDEQNMDITYYIGQEDAETAQNWIADPTAYASAAATIYVRIQSQNDPACYIITTIELIPQYCSNNVISGIITYDFDQNGCSPTDYPAANIGVYCIVGEHTYQTFTNNNGYYEFTNLHNGIAIITVTQAAISFTVSPSSQFVTLPGNGQNKNFCLSVLSPVNDVAVSIVPVTAARPGVAAVYAINYQNLGSQPENGTISFEFPAALMLYVSTEPQMTATGNTLSFNYNGLLPFQTKTILVQMQLNIPPVVNGGDVLNFSATITSDTDTNQENNTYSLHQVVVNSYDPNDILVKEGDYISLAQAQEDFLTYTIRFQNTGDADALNIRIANTLDDNFDKSSFTPVAASHNYHILRNGNQVQFFFDDINLPGMQVNEPESHGFITYKIRPKADIQETDSMQNNASIYFDFNLPEITNTVTTTVQTPMGLNENFLGQFTMYPNPASGAVNLNVKNSNTAGVTISDVLGKVIITSKISQAESSIDISALNTGVYFITVTAQGKSETKKLIIK